MLPRLHRHLLALALLAAAHAPCAAATLRLETVLHGPDVRLSDLFDEAGTQGSRILGPSPPPGASIIVEAPQLAAIARQFGVDWQPSSPGDRARLRRAGMTLPYASVIEAVKTALATSGAPDGDLAVPDFTPPVVPPEAHARPEVDQVAWDPASGRFTAALAIIGDGIAPLQMRLSGRLEVTETVILARRRLRPGEVLAPADLRPGRVRSALLRGEAARVVEQAEGLTPRRPIETGQPLLLADLSRPAMVTRGGPVSMTLEEPGLAVTASGIALQAGTLGDRVEVLNPASHAVLVAEVSGSGLVRIAPGSRPVPSRNQPKQAALADDAQ